MRRITGTYDGVEYVLHEYDRGIVECPAALADLLRLPDNSLPIGEDLENACRVLFGESLQVREV
jgi:hypothetical protein